MAQPTTFTDIENGPDRDDGLALSTVPPRLAPHPTAAPGAEAASAGTGTRGTDQSTHLLAGQKGRARDGTGVGGTSGDSGPTLSPVKKSWLARSGVYAVGGILLLCGVMGLLIGLHVFALPEDNPDTPPPTPPKCDNTCIYNLAESIPLGMKVNSTYPSIYSEWMSLITSANYTIDIACMYMTLTKGNAPNVTGAQQGQDVYDALVAAAKRGVKIRVASSEPGNPPVFPQEDLLYLNNSGLIELRYVNFPMYYGSGVLHTKFILIDDKLFYVGSANMDWRSLTQVKEIGFILRHCLCFARDLAKIFRIYWKFADFTHPSQVPTVNWPPAEFETSWNVTHPANMSLNGTAADMFISVAPPVIASPYRTYDLDAVLDIINNATVNISVSVMDYAPAMVFTPKKEYWPVIDDALRAAAYTRKVNVRLMFSLWNNSSPDLIAWGKSLNDEPGIDVKLYQTPLQANAPYEPFTRVQHDKYLVSEKSTWLGTSNWAGDYFTVTGGVAINSGQAGLRRDVQAVFDRDYNSKFAFNVDDYNPTPVAKPKRGRLV